MLLAKQARSRKRRSGANFTVEYKTKVLAEPNAFNFPEIEDVTTLKM